MKISTLPPTVLAFILVLASAGCSFKSDVEEGSEFFKKIFRKDTYTMYRIDVQQGNTLDPAKLARLEPGMTKEQVRYLFGNPVSDNVFHKNRWNYTYYLMPGEGGIQKYRLILFFDGDRLRDIRKSKQLTELTKEPRKEKKKPRKKKDSEG